MTTSAISPVSAAPTTTTSSAAPAPSAATAASTSATTNTQDSVTLSDEAQEEPTPPTVPPQPNPGLPPLPIGSSSASGSGTVGSATNAASNASSGAGLAASVPSLASKTPLLDEGAQVVSQAGKVSNALGPVGLVAGGAGAVVDFANGNTAGGIDNTLGVAGTALALSPIPGADVAGVALAGYAFFDSLAGNAFTNFLLGPPKPTVQTTQNGDGSSSTFRQSGDGKTQSFTDQDPNGKLTAFEDYTKEGNGNISRSLGLADPNNAGDYRIWNTVVHPDKSSDFSYNDHNTSITSHVTPDGSATTKVGNTVYQTDPSGDLFVTFPDGSTASYDGNHQLIASYDPNGHKTGGLPQV